MERGGLPGSQYTGVHPGLQGNEPPPMGPASVRRGMLREWDLPQALKRLSRVAGAEAGGALSFVPKDSKPQD